MRLLQRKQIAIFLIAACAHYHWANAQNALKNELAAGCLSAKNIRAPQLYGLWQVTFTTPPAGLPKSAVMLLQKHEEFGDSLSGTVSRDVGGTAAKTPPNPLGHAAKAALAGDVEDGFVILDESSDNISISGTWNGQLTENACGREITGVWKDTSASAPPDAPDVAFTMLKRPGW